MSAPPPIRLCCGKAHSGAMCPDGLVMCVLCFKRVSVDKLNLNEEGRREDVCQKCADEEREFAKRSGKSK